MAIHPPRVRHRWFAAAWDRFIEPAGRAKLEPHRRFAAGEARGRVIEIGAGTGANLPYYDWSKVEALYLTEPDPHMAKRMQRRIDSLPPEARDKVHVHEAPAESLPFADHEFDCAVVTLVLCSVADLPASLQELRRVLKPDGELRLVEHVKGGALVAPAQKLVQPVYGWLAGGCNLSSETESQLREAGFSLTITGRPSFGGPLSPGISGIARPRGPRHHAPMPARALQRRRRLLKRGAYLIDRHFRRRWQRYLLQAGLAAATLAAVVALEETLTNAAIVTAIASSAVIIFISPHSRMSSPRRVLGGHLIAILVGLVIGAIVHDWAGEPFASSLVTDVAAAVGVGVVMLLMAATDTEHPPAAGTVLGLVLAPNPLSNGLLVIAAALALTGVRTVFRPWLIDLSH
jgi:SAM-dependent methyltransferase